jgi:hypothetical protein
MHAYQIWCELDSGPLGVSLNISKPPFKWKMQFEDGSNGIASLYLNQTNNALVVYESSFKVTNLTDLILAIKSTVQSLYDAALLHCGIATRVEIKSYMTDDNNFGRAQLNDVTTLGTSSLLGLSIEETTKCAIDSVVVRMALADLRNAMLNLNDLGLFCYRSIEIMLQDYKESEDEESKTAWPKMRSSLRFEKSYVQPIVDLSVKNRHGNVVNFNKTQAKDLISRTVILLERYCKARVIKNDIDREPILQ